MADAEIIQLEDGWSRVYNQGVKPFINFIESNEREFFKAKEFVSLYDLIFKMCIQREPYNWSAEVYDRYTKSIKEYLESRVCTALTAEQEKGTEASFLRMWVKKWNNHKLVVRGLAKVFMYLDRFHVQNSDGLLALKDQGHRLYREFVFQLYSPYARTAILNAIARERENEIPDTLLLSQSVNVFVEIGFFTENRITVYQKELQAFIIEHASDYYQRKCRTWLDSDSCPTYLEKAEACLAAEKRRVEAYLNQCTMDDLLQETYKQLLKSCQTELLGKSTGVTNMLELNRTADLARLFRLYQRYPQDLPPIGALVEDHIYQVGAGVVDRESKVDQKAPDANHSLVRSLIDLHQQYATVVKDCFGNNQVFQKALKTAFEKFINMDNRVSKLLARFVHEMLKKHSKVKTSNIQATLDNIVFLYGYITDKDVFERDYQSYLSNRLLMGLCESEFVEKDMIAKLKTECGYQWTSRLEGMFKDVQLSKEALLKFNMFYDTEKKLGLQLDVNVCTTGYWPTSKTTPCNMPHELQVGCDQYKQFYLSSHPGHKLEWKMDQGQAEVQIMFSKTVKRTLICSTYQMMILVVFNNSGKPVTFKEILDVTGIPRYEIANHLLSLVHPNVKVLLKKPNVKKLEDDDQFMINPKFESKVLKVQVPVFQAMEETKKKDDDDVAIELQRQHQMDAAIVRIMKTRKTLKHNALVAEVIQQLQARFQPKPPLIKKRIEALIELEYLKRDEEDRSMYNYLA